MNIQPYIERLPHRKLRTGKIVTGGIITIKDSNWLMSFATHRQPHFKEQSEAQTITWVYGLLSNTPGNFVKKPIEQCTGEEIAMELLYHLGVPEKKIGEMAKQDCSVIPVNVLCRKGSGVVANGQRRMKVAPEAIINGARLLKLKRILHALHLQRDDCGFIGKNEKMVYWAFH